MDFRIGKCSQCGAQYNIPASFAHNVARCKKCKGVVHIGASGAAPESAAKAPPTPPAAPAAPRPPATPAASIPAKKVVPKPEAPRAARPPAPSAPPTSPPRPAPKPAPAAEPPRKGGTLERLKSERQASAPPPAPPAPSGARPSPTAAASRKGDEHASHVREKRAERGERAKNAREKKKAPVVGILSGVALVAVAAVLVLFRDQLFGGGAEPEPTVAEGTPTSPEAGAPATEPAGPAAREPAATDPAAEAEPTPAEAPKAEEPKATPKGKDPSSIDLAAIPDFQPTPDTSPEEWAQMNEWMAQWMDVDAGAAGNRAKLELIKRTRKAVPAILNFFKRQDFATKEGRSNGDQCQKALQQICNGTNFDWKYADEAAGRPFDHPDDVWFCKRVVELWSNSWKQAEQDIRAWIKIAKLEDKDPAEAKRLLEMFGSQSAEPEAGGEDDLEVD